MKKINIIFVAIILAVILTAGCTDQNANQNNGDNAGGTQIGDITITSSAFQNGGNIPINYTYFGNDISPPLSFDNIPEGAETLVLILDDPDALGGTRVHWIVFNIPAEITGFEEDAILPYYFGENGWGVKTYDGPYPPDGEEHRYYFRLYALDTSLDLHDGASRQQVDAAMNGHILGQTSLMGKYGS